MSVRQAHSEGRYEFVQTEDLVPYAMDRVKRGRFAVDAGTGGASAAHTSPKKNGIAIRSSS
jgi:hypothetical protein